MARRGNEAKVNLINRFIDQNTDIYIGCFDKKYYFWSTEDGEKVQIALSLTCPSNPIGATETTLAPTVADDSEFPPLSSVVSQEEQDNIAKLMERLGL